jgi:hypothetical protein
MCTPCIAPEVDTGTTTYCAVCGTGTNQNLEILVPKFTPQSATISGTYYIQYNYIFYIYFHSQEFNTLKKSLGNVSNFAALDTVEFLMPFLDVIRSEVKTGGFLLHKIVLFFKF